MVVAVVAASALAAKLHACMQYKAKISWYRNTIEINVENVSINREFCNSLKKEKQNKIIFMLI